MQVFRRLFYSLNRKRVRYMVAGGIAVNLYGIERATADIDIILRLDRKNLLKFVDVAKKLGLRSKVPVKLEDFVESEKRRDWIESKGMRVFSLYDSKNPFFLLDAFVEIPFDFDEVYNRRKKMKFENIAIPVVPLKELIKMKEMTERPQDRADAFYLKRIMQDWGNE